MLARYLPSSKQLNLPLQYMLLEDIGPPLGTGLNEVFESEANDASHRKAPPMA